MSDIREVDIHLNYFEASEGDRLITLAAQAVLDPAALGAFAAAVAGLIKDVIEHQRPYRKNIFDGKSWADCADKPALVLRHARSLMWPAFARVVDKWPYAGGDVHFSRPWED